VPDFNSFGARRGNHEIMMRGTFGNVRMQEPDDPGETRRLAPRGRDHDPPAFRGADWPIYEAAMKYIAEGVPTVVFGGEEYGTGSSRDWAAKGTLLLGVRAVIVKSFERDPPLEPRRHGRAALPVKGSDTAASLGIKATKPSTFAASEGEIKPPAGRHAG